MKIGVLTFWHGNANYGMMLQCWAMQEKLKQMGHQPFVIRFATERAKGLPRRILEKLKIYKSFLYFVSPQEYCLLKSKEKHDKLRKFDYFRQTNLALSERMYKTLKELQDNPPKADCYIVGSDQVWSQILNNADNEAYFLNFGSPEIKRIAYAPSFGFNAADYPKDVYSVLKKALSRMDAISCREQSGVTLCEELGFTAIKVLDPTFLLSKESYMNICPKCKPLTSQPYVFIYSLNIQSCDDIRFEELNSYIQCQHLDLVVTPADGYTQGQELFGKQALYSYATVEQWLSNIVNSLLVVTASFHGVVLSIILERPFIYVPLSGSHSGSNGRILEVLNFLGLTDRILTADKTYKEIAQANINWKVVNDKLSQSKQESIEYLNKLLGVVVCKL